MREDLLFPRLAFPLEIVVLFYGDYPDLASRLLGSLWDTMPLDLFRLRIGLNAVSPETATIAHDYVARHPEACALESQENLFKYPMMERLLREPGKTSRWLLWLDDDSHFTRKDWWVRLAHEVEIAPEVKLFGQIHRMRIGQEQVDKIGMASWNRGKPLIEVEDDGSALVTFPTGGFWLMERESLQCLQWPDKDLKHNGGDYLLGEAARQQGWPLAFFDYGVAINDSDRRSPVDAPVPY